MLNFFGGLFSFVSKLLAYWREEKLREEGRREIQHILLQQRNETLEKTNHTEKHIRALSDDDLNKLLVDSANSDQK